MCSSSHSAPKVKAAPPVAPATPPASVTADASSAAAREQAMRRGLASVWTRYGADNSGTATPAAPAAQLADKLGG